MQHRLATALSAALICGVNAHVSSQSFVFPADHEKVEGSSSTTLPLLLGPFRYQVCSSETKGRRILVRSLSYRRSTDAFSLPTNKGASITLSVQIGQGDYATLGTTFAQNWIGMPSTVVRTKTIKSPDWTTASTTVPASFDFVIPFDTPYVYDGKNDLLLETLVTSQRESGNGFLDGVFRRSNGDKFGASRTVAKGCLVGGREQGALFTFRSIGGGMNSEMRCRTFGAPPLSPAGFLIGFTNPNVTIPGLCTTLNTSAEISIPLGNADGLGLAEVIFSLGAYDGKLAGASLYGQAFALDPTQAPIRIGLSETKQLVLPPQKEGPVVLKNLGTTDTTASSVRRVGNSGTVFKIN